MKKKWINGLAIAIASAFTSLAIPLKETITIAETAEETRALATTFVMQEGASVQLFKRPSDESEPSTQNTVVPDNSMKFIAEISADEYDSLKNVGARFGMLIVAKDLIKGLSLTPETVFGADSPFYFTNKTENKVEGKKAMINITSPSCVNIDTDSNMEICGSIINIKLSNFTRSYVGLAYVQIPSENGYEYQFAKFYNDDMANNTRCLYYVAQRALGDAELDLNNEKIDASGKEAAQNTITAVNTTYFDKFNVEGNTRYSALDYMYKVQHHYIEHDSSLQGTGEAQHVIVYTHEEIFYAPLHSQQEIHPIQKPTTAFGGLTVSDWDKLDDKGKESKANEYNISVELLNKFLNHHYIFDVGHTSLHRNGRVYAAGMQTFHLYYEASSTINDGHANKTLAELLQHFLDVKNVEPHFGIKLSENGWSAEQIHVMENNQPVVNEKGEYVNHGIQLHTNNPQKPETLLLTKEFFEELRAYGVEAITFTFTTGTETNKNVAYNVLQEENGIGKNASYVKVYNPANGNALQNSNNKDIKQTRIKIYLEDITPQGGLLFLIAESSSSSNGNYIFEDVEFQLYHDAQNV